MGRESVEFTCAVERADTLALAPYLVNLERGVHGLLGNLELGADRTDQLVERVLKVLLEEHLRLLVAASTRGERERRERTATGHPVGCGGDARGGTRASRAGVMAEDDGCKV